MRFSVRRLTAVVAVIGLLCGLIIVPYQRAKEGERHDQCQKNLKNIALGLLGYEEAKGAFPAAAHQNPDLPVERRLSWMAAISPYFDYADLYNLFNHSAPWDGPENLRLSSLEIGILYCPTVRKSAPTGQTQYVGITGVGPDSPGLATGHPRAGVFGFDRVTRPGDIKDGAGMTLLLAETAGRNGPWTAGGIPTVRPVDPAFRPYIGQGRPFGGLHPGGVNVAFADGSVKFLSETIDPKVFEALATVAGGEPLPVGWDR